MFFRTGCKATCGYQANSEMPKWSALKALELTNPMSTLSYELRTLAALLNSADKYFIKSRPRSEINDFCKVLRGTYWFIDKFSTSTTAQAVLSEIAKHPRIKVVKGSNDIDHDETYK